MAISLQQFAKQLAEASLVSSTEVEALVENLPADRRPADGDQLARELVRQNKLTPFQAQQIYAGKGASLVLGNYVILEKLGQGGMGTVLKAEHRRMERLVALKVLSPKVTTQAGALLRFQREVKAAGRLTHPNIVIAHDADEAGGTQFLVMEYVPGRDLGNLVKHNGTLPVDVAVGLVQQAALGLKYAHQNGIVHRDIKPGNLLLANDGTVKILDLGLARLESDELPHDDLTATGQIMGTIDYMAPEQALNTKSADARSDIYSLGITLWYLLTGKEAYAGESMMAKLLAHREHPIPELPTVRPDVPAALQRVFETMVAKKPADRYLSMGAVVEALAPFASRGPVPATLLGDSQCSASSLILKEEMHSFGAVLPQDAVSPKHADRMKGTCVTLPPVAAASQFELDTILDPAALAAQAKLSERPSSAVSGQSTLQELLADKRTRAFAGGATGTLVTLLVVWALFFSSGGENRGFDAAAQSPNTPLTAIAAPMTLPEPLDNGLPQSTNTASNTNNPPPGDHDLAHAAIAARQNSVPPAGLSSPASTERGTPPANTAASPNYALEFDGQTSYVEVPTPAWDGKSPLTIEAWVDSPLQQRFPGIIAGFSGQALVQLHAGGDGKESGEPHWMGLVAGRDHAAVAAVHGQSPRLEGRPWHLALVLDDSRLRLFENGKLVDDQPHTRNWPLGLNGRGVHIGAQFDSRQNRWAYHFLGTLDELRISRSARYQKEFLPQRRFVPDAETIALFHCDEGSGTALSDASGNGHHGTVSGAKWVKSSVVSAVRATNPPANPDANTPLSPKGIASATPANPRPANTSEAASAPEAARASEAAVSQGAVQTVDPGDQLAAFVQPAPAKQEPATNAERAEPMHFRCGAVNLLAALDPEKISTSKLRWQRAAAHIVGVGMATGNHEDSSDLAFPLELTGDYDLELDLVHAGGGPLQIHLPLLDADVWVSLSAQGGGLFESDGKTPLEQPDSVKNDAVSLSPNAVHRFIATVRLQGDAATVEARLDNVLVGRYSGPRSRLIGSRGSRPDYKHIKIRARGDHSKFRMEIHRAIVKSVRNSAMPGKTNPNPNST